MGDKFAGALAGGGRSNADQIHVPEALQTLSIHETLVAADEEGSIILLRAVQNPDHGGIMVTAQPAAVDSACMTEAIKLSQMTSMLKDTSRCSKYGKAIELALNARPNSRVLDIGTGTGMLAMLAARSGAIHVDAIEMFEPLANLASRVVRDNEFHKKISVHAIKSTALSVASEQNDIVTNTLSHRADILVTEIFDSALLGEACVPVINHALEHLVKADATVIPGKAKLYGSIVRSELCSKFQNLGENFPLHRTDLSRYCKAGSGGIPIHIDALELGTHYQYLTDPFLLFQFEFSKGHCPEERTQQFHVRRSANGIPNGVLTWWELDLTGKGDVLYSTKPGDENWQDHWLPVLYPLPSGDAPSQKGRDISFAAGHNELSFWFSYGVDVKSSPPCICGFHALPGGPYRIMELGDERRLSSLSAKIGIAIEEASKFAKQRRNKSTRIRCIDVSDSSVCGILTKCMATHTPVDVLSVEEDNELSAYLYEQVSRVKGTQNSNHLDIEYNPLSVVLERELIQKKNQAEWSGYDVILSEPYTRSMHAYPISTLGNLIVQRRALSELLEENFTAVPRTARVKAQAIRFAPGTLQEAFGAVNEVQGLDHSSFASLYKEWPGTDRISVPLFQYNTEAVTDEAVLHTFDLCTTSEKELIAEREVYLKLSSSSPPEAVALWAEYDNEPSCLVARSEIVWLSEADKAAIGLAGCIRAICAFHIETGTFTFDFSPEEAP